MKFLVSDIKLYLIGIITRPAEPGTQRIRRGCDVPKADRKTYLKLRRLSEKEGPGVDFQIETLPIPDSTQTGVKHLLLRNVVLEITLKSQVADFKASVNSNLFTII